MRIAVATRIFPAVSQTFVSDHAAGLLRRGHDVEVLCTHDEQLAERRGVAIGRVHEWSSSQKSLARDLWAAWCRAPSGSLQALPRFLADRSAHWWHFTWWSLVHSRSPFEVIHAHFAGQGETLAWLKAQGLLRVPLVVSTHGFDVTPHAKQGRNPYPNVFAHADRVVATTAFMGEQVLRLGCPPEKLALNPTGIQLEAFAPREARWQAGETLRLLSVTRLVEVKGIRYAIEAVAKLAAEGVDIEYTVAGDGPLKQELEALATRLGLRSRVHFRGPLPRAAVLQEYARNHLLLFPSCTSADGQTEAQGIATMEAQACGLPVIATRHGGIPEVVRDGETGLLVAEADAEALAQGIRAMLARAADWPAMGRAGRAWIESQFTLDRHLERLEDLYRTLLPNR